MAKSQFFRDREHFVNKKGANHELMAKEKSKNPKNSKIFNNIGSHDRVKKKNQNQLKCR